MDYTNLVVVHECGSEIEANLAKGALQAAGIDAMIQGGYGRTPTRPHRMVGRRLQASGARRGRRRRPGSTRWAAGGIAAPPTGTDWQIVGARRSRHFLNVEAGVRGTTALSPALLNVSVIVVDYLNNSDKHVGNYAG